jgi:hypothetical protein
MPAPEKVAMVPCISTGENFALKEVLMVETVAKVAASFC